MNVGLPCEWHTRIEILCTAMHLSPHDIKRFWSFVSIPTDRAGRPDIAQPWLWMGSTSADGHGRFWVNGRNVLAHRVSFFIAHGWLPEMVCHVEPVPGDVNPHRLYAGSAAENVADRQRQGRQARGQRNGRTRLSDAAVRWARNAIVHGTSLSEAARRLGVHKTTLRAAVTGKTWQHLGEHPNTRAEQPRGVDFTEDDDHPDPPNAASRL